MTIADIVRNVESSERILSVVNRESEPRPLVDLLADLVDDEDVTVRERQDVPDHPDDTVLLEDDEGALAVSSLGEVARSVLLVNADLYVTGTRPAGAVETPDVIASLADTTFPVEGKQKFLLIQMSRHVESIALGTGTGVLHAGFQRLSRVDDERGTRRVYERLSDSGVETHAYGVPDISPADLPAVSCHGIDNQEIRDSWFVVFEGDGREGALLAERTGSDTWDGVWTFDPDIVAEVADYLEARYLDRS